MVTLTDKQKLLIEDMIDNHGTPYDSEVYEAAEKLQTILQNGFYKDSEREFLNNEREWFLEYNDWPRE